MMDVFALGWPASLTSKFVTGVAVLAFYGACLTMYRLYFSPIAKFPGPKIAAATSWYEFYYDFFRKGSYIFEIEKMHQEYG